ncbi:MAG: hypothetical protein AB7V42_08540 [Thermoleophilia bacterium]
MSDEVRWRGQSALAAAIVIALYWVATWLLGEDVQVERTALAVVVAAVPTIVVTAMSAGRRVREGVSRAAPPPSASVRETAASSRDRRMRFAGIVLSGIVALLIVDHFTGGGGIMAGLMVGLLGGLGSAEWAEAGRWEDAERERETRLYALVRPDALTPRIGAVDVFETPRPGEPSNGRHGPGPFDLDV